MRSFVEPQKGIVVISGATQGIGRACARKFEDLGYQLCLISRNQNHLSELEKQLRGSEHLFFEADLLDSDACSRLFHSLSDKYIEGLVQCIGGNPENKTWTAWESMMELYFYLSIRLTELFVKQASKEKGGFVVHISSTAAVNGEAFTPYACSKAALNRYIVNRGKEILKQDIKLFAVMPPCVEGDDNGWSKTKQEDPRKYENMIKKQALGRLWTTDEVAEIIASLATSDALGLGGCVIPLDPSIC